MGIMTPNIPGLPRDWVPIFFQQSVAYPRDAVVMCKRSAGGTQSNADYVVWSVNMIEGGCHGGTYTNEHNTARLEFSRRTSRLS